MGGAPKPSRVKLNSGQGMPTPTHTGASLGQLQPMHREFAQGSLRSDASFTGYCTAMALMRPRRPRAARRRAQRAALAYQPLSRAARSPRARARAPAPGRRHRLHQERPDPRPDLPPTSIPRHTPNVGARARPTDSPRHPHLAAEGQPLGQGACAALESRPPWARRSTSSRTSPHRGAPGHCVCASRPSLLPKATTVCNPAQERQVWLGAAALDALGSAPLIPPSQPARPITPSPWRQRVTE